MVLLKATPAASLSILKQNGVRLKPKCYIWPSRMLKASCWKCSSYVHYHNVGKLKTFEATGTAACGQRPEDIIQLRFSSVWRNSHRPEKDWKQLEVLANTAHEFESILFMLTNYS